MNTDGPGAGDAGMTAENETGPAHGPHPETYREGKLDVRRVALISNPKAGKGRTGDKLAKARNRLAELGVDVVHMQGSSPQASRELAAEAVADDAIDVIACCGGDGLVSLVLQEQAMSGKPIGIIPTGTGNDHAREHGIPLDPERAAETIAVGRFRTTDLGLMKGPGFEDHWFGTIAMAGFDSLVTERTNQISWPTGKSRYVAAIAIEFAKFHSLPARLVIERDLVLDENLTMVAIGNTRTYGGGMKVCPTADPTDGMLNVTVLKRLSRRRAAMKFPKIFTGDFLNEEGVSTFRASHISLRMDGVTAFADGDPVGPADFTVECVPGAGCYIVP
ncbi:diacylglycerol kinase family protein [Corynebacterium hansenii]|uniref:Diacylglycerol kinase family protein n=1 Tax=Corynebacterium hansenii TaxID=394964 RepID=A0ABV7ZMW5_9CORY|nr:diacylglycerol kinase family protein [Corynebacterium hansenii]WJY99422.1 Diacylglycerol kinase [Corynebacterium hansenii]